MGGTDATKGGREGGRVGGSDDVRQRWSGSGGWEVNNSLLHTVRTLQRYHAWNGTSEEGTKRGMDGARERKEGLSEQRKEGVGREGAIWRIEEQGRSEGSEQGRQGYF